VLRRPKLAAYVSPSESTAFLTELARVVQLVPIRERVELCRDPRDDKFLELALAGRADFLLTGDADLLALHPFGELRLSARQRISTTPSAAWRRTRLRKNGCEAEASA
jgi:predicted nucleic acid-binding protein